MELYSSVNGRCPTVIICSATPVSGQLMSFEGHMYIQVLLADSHGIVHTNNYTYCHCCWWLTVLLEHFFLIITKFTTQVSQVLTISNLIPSPFLPMPELNLEYWNTCKHYLVCCYIGIVNTSALGHAKEIFCFSDSAGLFLADLKKFFN
jgi:hypothetical protein